MSGISTHVLDISLGQPAAGIPVTLEQNLDGSWHGVSSHSTNRDGRVPQLLPDSHALEAGAYRISFETEPYYAAQQVAGLYPLVQITFFVRDPAAHYHIPLLLTANGYSTYRGS